MRCTCTRGLERRLSRITGDFCDVLSGPERHRKSVRLTRQWMGSTVTLQPAAQKVQPWTFVTALPFFGSGQAFEELSHSVRAPAAFRPHPLNRTHSMGYCAIPALVICSHASC